jgi:hypothetical protein
MRKIGTMSLDLKTRKQIMTRTNDEHDEGYIFEYIAIFMPTVL